jgi:hypothetical protein
VNLFEALSFLARIHTKDAQSPGMAFIILMGQPAANIVDMTDYNVAWNEVRRAIGMPHFPEN